MALVRNSVLRAGSVIETSLYSDDAIGPGIRNLFVMLMRLLVRLARSTLEAAQQGRSYAEQ